MEILDKEEQWYLATKLLVVVVVVVFIDRFHCCCRIHRPFEPIRLLRLLEVHHIQILVQLVLICDLTQGRGYFSSTISFYFHGTAVDSVSKISVK